MKKRLSLLLLLSLFACNDGDIIVSNFDFSSDTELELCKVNNINVLYNVNPETNEAISFRFVLADFDGTFEGLCPPDPVTLSLNTQNQITYRRLSEETDGADYFCQEIPPAQPTVIEEFTSLDGGEAQLIFFVSNQDDEDDVPANLEDLNGDGNLFNDDSDNDGIPNFLDTDDDNDNVPTSVEIVNEDNPDIFPDFDEDGLPNYLDEDDDNDGVITRWEDLDAFDNLDDQGDPILNPRTDLNEEGIPNYLNPEISEVLEIDLYRTNSIRRTFNVQVVLQNVSLVQSNGEQTITLNTLRLGTFQIESNNKLLEVGTGPVEACEN